MNCIFPYTFVNLNIIYSNIQKNEHLIEITEKKHLENKLLSIFEYTFNIFILGVGKRKINKNYVNNFKEIFSRNFYETTNFQTISIGLSIIFCNNLKKKFPYS